VGPDESPPLELQRLDVYQEAPPDNIALPLEASNKKVWVRRAVYAAAEDRQPVQLHVSWITGLTSAAEDAIRGIDARMPWPQAVGEITGRPVVTVQQNTRARQANPFEAATLGIPDASGVGEPVGRIDQPVPRDMDGIPAA
jgi:hypothetical protein